MNNNKILIYGKHPVFSILKAKKRKIFGINIVDQNKKEFYSTVEREDIDLKGINVKFMSHNEMDGMFNHLYKEKNHQGYIIFVNEKEEITLDDFINEFEGQKELPKLLILDQIVDPHNLGALLRTAVAFGVFNVIITAFNSTKETATVSKSSAGLNELVNVIEVINLNNAIKELKNIGYFVYGLDGEAKTLIEQVKDSSNIALILGNEGKGIRELVKKNCDELVKIKMHEYAESLNVSVAGGIAMYQVWGKY
ncbi:MAG: 23S rRNA (guanosine(2251)-2'-O)-methyltransferase RlmB [Rickettsiales bacterium]|jgi:23S rRNA (guanosine2251-2'-O)-methyltransferase|nr:23S rRNA (guanosine(2251)-2'-O)-methyltransferase RlmB [Rickettsiales bacterium]